jgi:hypothetical protein
MVPTCFQTQHLVSYCQFAIKCNKSTPKIEMSFDFGASTSFINKELVQQLKLALMKDTTLMVMEVIDG